MAGDADFTALRVEVERLRNLVGYPERSYADLRRDLLEARDAVKTAETEAGQLRGELTELHVALARARQIEAVLRATFSGRVFCAARRVRRLAMRALGKFAVRLR